MVFLHGMSQRVNEERTCHKELLKRNWKSENAILENDVGVERWGEDW